MFPSLCYAFLFSIVVNQAADFGHLSQKLWLIAHIIAEINEITHKLHGKNCAYGTATQQNLQGKFMGKPCVYGSL